jgi:hypothetical protein
MQSGYFLFEILVLIVDPFGLLLDILNVLLQLQHLLHVLVVVAMGWDFDSFGGDKN